jgi:hypothetical protein
LGKPDYDLSGTSSEVGGDVEESKLSHVSLLEQFDNQTSAQNSGEDTAAESNFGGGGGSSKGAYKTGYQFGAANSGVVAGGSYYELIVHKLVHYNVRKYPDEIITRNVILKGSRKH